MGRFDRNFLRFVATGGVALLLLAAPRLDAQSVPPRLRGAPGPNGPRPHASVPPAAPQPAASVQPASPAAGAPPQLPVAQPALSMLQQPAQEARIVFAGDSLAIHADNSSLTAILHQVAARSGMRIEGLNGDERVFGSFGPGAPRDVLADLLNGTAYNVVLIGDLSHGGDLILSPATRAGATPAPAPQVNQDEASTDQDSPDGPLPQPDPQPSVPPPPPASPGVRTPQQLFEQLQHMRQGQQQDPPQPPQAPQ